MIRHNLPLVKAGYQLQRLPSERSQRIMKFSPSVDVKVKKDAVNPKRRLRVARKQSQSAGIGTKSQQALQLHLLQSKSI